MNTARLTRTGVLKVTLVAAAALLAAWLLALVGTQPKQAEAAFPGINGKIVFAGGMWEDPTNGSEDMFTINPDGTGLTQLTDTPRIHEEGPSWSPDGATIAYTATFMNPDPNDPTAPWTTALYTVSASGGEPSLIIDDETELRRDVVWSPDGKRLAYSAPGGTDFEIYTVSASGGTPTQVTDNTHTDIDPSWSPDGTNIVYSGQNSEGYQDIFKIPVTQQGAANGVPINLTNDRTMQFTPDYSPSGTEIAINLWDEDGLPSLSTIPAAGGAPTRLVTENHHTCTGSDCLGRVEHFAYAPDGTKIAFSEGVSLEPSLRCGKRLYTVPSSGGTLTAVTDCSIRVSSAAGIDWQPITNINDQIAAVQDSLDAIINDSNLNPKLAEELVGANGTLQDAITELGSGNTQAGLQRLEQAMSDIEPALEAAVADGSLDASQANQIMNDLALVAQRIAVQAIEDAQERGGDPTQIEEAQLDLDDGDALRESGAYMEAVDKYKDALAKAEGA